MHRLAASLAAFLAASPLALAAEQVSPPPGAEPFEVHLEVGKLFLICRSGELLCPATAPLCDDPAVAVPELTPADGLAWKGVGKGKTLCSAGGPGGNMGGGARRVFRVTVK